ncbi:CLUMA_CG011657, isoform A [Clunio marinus]|uniref:CLUMA_CG011657, isoform A n=1 Tax=Clunio marinus TaxID=568069 RepID=A0A1J1IDD3_9DIPT|nr:CLUMA_CG011657, isoform A [Clunio marinus]
MYYLMISDQKFRFCDEKLVDDIRAASFSMDIKRLTPFQLFQNVQIKKSLSVDQHFDNVKKRKIKIIIKQAAVIDCLKSDP